MEKETLKHLAELSFINLSTNEEREFIKQLNNLFLHIEDTLKQVKKTEIETKDITLNKLELFHKDYPIDEYTKEDMLLNVKKEKNGFILVPKIIKEDK